MTLLFVALKKQSAILCFLQVTFPESVKYFRHFSKVDTRTRKKGKIFVPLCTSKMLLKLHSGAGTFLFRSMWVSVKKIFIE